MAEQEHRVIYLEPRCTSDAGEDRHWCQDDTWGPCVECGTKPVKYIIASDHEALVKALTDTLCELSHCATQLATRGLPGRDGDSVSRAQQDARDILSRVGGSRE